MFEEDWIGLMKCAGNANALHEVNPVSRAFGDEKDRWIRPTGRARGDGPGLRFGFSNAVFPSWFPSMWRLTVNGTMRESR
jgi:hypothetical protein